MRKHHIKYYNKSSLREFDRLLSSPARVRIKPGNDSYIGMLEYWRGFLI